MSNRKRTPGRPIQVIKEPDTITYKSKGKKITVPNPKAGKTKQIKHRPGMN